MPDGNKDGIYSIFTITVVPMELAMCSQLSIAGCAATRFLHYTNSENDLGRLLERIDGCTDLLRHRGRKRSIVKRAGLVLMLQHPLEKIDEDFPVGGILGGIGNQKPGEAGDGIGVLCRCVGDGDTVIGRHVLETCRRFRHSFDRCLQPGSSGAAHVGKGDFVLHGVDEFDVPNRTRRLTDEAGNAFVAFRAYPPGPARRRALAGAACPVFADLRQIVGEDVSGAAAVGTVYDKKCPPRAA